MMQDGSLWSFATVRHFGRSSASSVGGAGNHDHVTPTLDDDRALRRTDRRPVIRVPTAAMKHAQFHVGAVSWANPWEATEDGVLFRWIVARRDVLRGSTEFMEGNARALRSPISRALSARISR